MRGSALVVAIFLLVALSALGGFIISVTSGQQIGQALDIQGARAYQAARYGAEWSVYQLVRGDPAAPGFVAAISCDTAGTFCNACRAAGYAAPASRNLSGMAADLAGFTVTINCGSASYTEGGSTVWVHQVSATACNQPDSGACPNATAAGVTNIGYVERRISLNVTN